MPAPGPPDLSLKSSERTKTYLVHPYRLAYAQGGMYLLAYVPEYQEVRTFAIERIQDVSLLEERFTPIEELPDTAFPHSLGVHSGTPEHVEIAFEAAVVDYVRAREWHPSQRIQDGEAGAVVMSLDVCRDRALQADPQLGPFARVVRRRPWRARSPGSWPATARYAPRETARGAGRSRGSGGQVGRVRASGRAG